MVNSKVQLVNVWWSTWLLTTSEGSIFATMKKVHAFHACHSCQVMQRKIKRSWLVRQSTHYTWWWFLLHPMLLVVVVVGVPIAKWFVNGEGKGNAPLLEIFYHQPKNLCLNSLLMSFEECLQSIRNDGLWKENCLPWYPAGTHHVKQGKKSRFQCGIVDFLHRVTAPWLQALPELGSPWLHLM
jgi:hypothetical protein